MQDGDGWETQPRRGKKSSRKARAPVKDVADEGYPSPERQAAVREQIREFRRRIVASEWWQRLEEVLATQELAAGVRLRAYGLGSFSRSPESRVQLALAAELKQLLPFAGPCTLMDPVMNDFDLQLAGEVGFEASATSDDAVVSVSGTTVFYMPHCPRRLYNNVLESNWNPQSLKMVKILGNRLSNYSLQLRPRRLKDFIQAVEPVTVEIPVDISGDHEFYSSFNDHALSSFPDTGSAGGEDSAVWTFVPDKEALEDPEIL